MAGKYADRFRQLPPTNQPDVLDLGEIDRRPGDPHHDRDHDDVLSLEPAEGRRPWHSSWTVRIALVVMLFAGAAGGAFGWERWKIYEAAVAARSEVDLVASALTLNYSSEDEVAIALTYRNEGEYEIVVRDVRFEGDRLTPVSQPEVLKIAPAATETQIFTVRARCPNLPEESIEPPGLVVTVETIDGTTLDRSIQTDLVSAEVGQWYTYACSSQYYQPSFGDSYADFAAVTPNTDGTAVVVTIDFGLSEGASVQIDSVESASAAFSAEYTVDDPSSSDSYVKPPITVTYRVGDCQLALDSSEQDMALVITGAVEGTTPGEITAYPSPELAIELTRLVERTC